MGTESGHQQSNVKDVLLVILALLLTVGVTTGDSNPVVFVLAWILSLAIVTYLLRKDFARFKVRTSKLMSLTIFIVAGALIGGGLGFAAWSLVARGSVATEAPARSESPVLPAAFALADGAMYFVTIASTRRPMFNGRFALMVYNQTLVNTSTQSVTIQQILLQYDTSNGRYESTTNGWPTGTSAVGSEDKHVVILSGADVIMVQWMNDILPKYRERPLIQPRGVFNASMVFVLEQGVSPADITAMRLRIRTYPDGNDVIQLQPVPQQRFGRLVDSEFTPIADGKFVFTHPPDRRR